MKQYSAEIIQKCTLKLTFMIKFSRIYDVCQNKPSRVSKSCADLCGDAESSLCLTILSDMVRMGKVFWRESNWYGWNSPTQQVV